MYVRFVTPFRAEQSAHRLGVFRAAPSFQYLLRQEDDDRLEELYTWFNRFLAVPCRFARSKNRHAHKKAICWFKTSAERCIEKAREIAEILKKYGISTTCLTTRKPGYIVYEDEKQVAAIPFRDTLTATQER